MIIAIGLEVGGRNFLNKHEYFFRSVPVQDLAGYGLECSEKISKEVAFLCGKDHLETLKNVMNFVHCKYPLLPPSHDIVVLLDHARKGGSFLCSHMAELYLAALNYQGIKSRKIFIVKNFGDFNSHTTVEVFVDGRWVICDPSFHVSFIKNNQLLSAQEISESLSDGTFDQVKPLFYGEVTFPWRLETYYIHWLPLYNNVMYHRRGFYQRSASFLKRHTLERPLHYWHGPTRYYLTNYDQGNAYLNALDAFYYFIVVVLPLVIRALFLWIVMLTGFQLYKVVRKHAHDGK